MQEISYEPSDIIVYDPDRTMLEVTKSQVKQVDYIRQKLQTIFSAASSFSFIVRLNYTDGVRIIFANNDIAYFRPSGNANKIRIYSVADKQERTDEIASKGVAEPDGLLKHLERIV